ncbi:hypothetical protein DFJ67_0577 [Asanoa ferruginea]|uniref:Uncharacterized protein n=1 Tax=Asanoa ferruginea TaxID=53367 RepID=A0A3D9ZBM4_9ACTN|nr:hypothetical protein DFJ67_0577 [Asanoa ferruginea]GIF53051.1 hypothetical protein Afe04nite_75900 [Asanoa ferruginea]
MHYRLAQPFGGLSAGTQTKTWFFDVPESRDTDDGWAELLNRLFYDANALMRSREPGDTSCLAVDTFTTAPVSAATMLAWDGLATQERAAAHLPWILAAGAVSWEYSACYCVDDAGAYDGMTGNGFSELILYRFLDAGGTTPQDAVTFLDRLYPGHGESIFADRSQRFANLVEIRPSAAFRRPPGSTPWISGPPTLG